jgi:hypothetical protein
MIPTLLLVQNLSSKDPNRSDPIGGERLGMRKLKLPSVRSILWSRLTKSGRRAGWCGRKLMEPNQISPPPIVELLLGGTEKIADSMTLVPKISTDGAN